MRVARAPRAHGCAALLRGAVASHLEHILSMLIEFLNHSLYGTSDAFDCGVELSTASTTSTRRKNVRKFKTTVSKS